MVVWKKGLYLYNKTANNMKKFTITFGSSEAEQIIMEVEGQTLAACIMELEFAGWETENITTVTFLNNN